MDAFHELEIAGPPVAGLQTLLLAPRHRHLELPALADLTAAATALARGLKRKVLLPLDSTPTEYALVRRADEVVVSVYETGSAPEVHQLDRRVPLPVLLRACANAMVEEAQRSVEPTARQIAVRLAERAIRTQLAPDPGGDCRPEVRRGGSIEPGDEPLAFGFEIAIHPNPGSASHAARADVHALLFHGKLWVHVRGRRLHLGTGPVMLAVQRMVVAARLLVEACHAGRATHARLRAGSFGIAVKLDADEAVSLTFTSERGQLGAAALDVPAAVNPILQLASSMLRALLSVDPTQARNLRVTALRDEIREVRRMLRSQEGDGAFVNEDPDRVRLAVAPEATPARGEHAPAAETRGLRLEERWRIALDDLDASSVFFCGDRLVLSSASHTVAVDRDDGGVLWAREGSRATLMAGRALLRLSNDGDVEICDVADGEPRAIARVAPRIGGPTAALVSHGEGAPPVAVLAEGEAGLVAIDLRTGEPRWRFQVGRGAAAAMTRAGRVVLVACAGAVHAIDLASGEDLWRYTARGSFASPTRIVGDVVVAVAGRDCHGIDLFTGQRRWLRRLPQPAVADAVAARELVLVPVERDRVVALHGATGEMAWTVTDPGLGSGASSLHVDDRLIVNAPGGHLTALDLDGGDVAWRRILGEPLADEIPRTLEPVLRGGALFVPAGTVHVIGPRAGNCLGEVPCDLVPDRVRVDERGWVYVAEESGHVAAFAPAPSLRLIRGGR